MDDMRALFYRSFARFLSSDFGTILRGIHERNLCCRLAIQLETLASEFGLTDYFADTEYNRNGVEIKTILDERYKVVEVTCDLILHSRGEIESRDNLIAIEMKKSDRRACEKEKDRRRLRALTMEICEVVRVKDGVSRPKHVCGYELGIFAELDIARRLFTLEEFEKGESVRFERRTF